jgi:tetratricopeptide (TPR) repeat protein
VGEGAWPLERAEALNGLGLVLHALGQAEMEPDAVLREALGLRLARLGNEHRLVQISRNNLGRWLVRQGQFAEAEQLYNAALAALADEPCEVAVALHNNRGALADRQGRQAEALAELEQAVKLAALVLGERHPRRAMMLYNLAVLSEREGVPTAALDHYSLALELVRDAWGEEHPQSKEIREVLEAVLAEIDRAEP